MSNRINKCQNLQPQLAEVVLMQSKQRFSFCNVSIITKNIVKACAC